MVDEDGICLGSTVPGGMGAVGAGGAGGGTKGAGLLLEAGARPFEELD